MRVIGIDHVAIAVEELQPVLDLLGLFGLALESEEPLPEQALRSNMVAAGNIHIELLESLAPESQLARFLRDRGPGLHHVCIEVDDLDAAINKLTANGLRLVDAQPRADRAGRRVFIHPRSAHGVLLGVMQRHTVEP